MKQLHTATGRTIKALALFAGLAALGACDGENLFRTDDPPEITEFLVASDNVVELDSLAVGIEATGPRSIQALRLQFQGAFDKDTTYTLQPPERGTTISRIITVLVPSETQTAELTITGTAIDVVPDTSDPAVADVRVVDASPPTVSASVGPAPAPGVPLSVTIRAADARGVALVGAQIGDGVAFDTTVVESIRTSRDTVVTLRVAVPGLDVGQLAVIPFAQDVNDLLGQGEPALLELEDRKGPTFDFVETEPDSTIPLSDSLRVFASLQDPSGIRQITFVGNAYRGDPSMGTDSVVQRYGPLTITLPRPTEGDTLPRAYTFDPWLFAQDTLTVEPIELILRAVDGEGNVSDTTKVMYVGGPKLRITYPPDGFEVQTGRSFDVRVAVEDRTRLDSVKLALTGDLVADTFDLALPARTDTPMVLVQPVTMPLQADEVRLQARAWNTGEVEGQSQVVTLNVVTDQVTDTIPPVVTLSAQRLAPSNSGERMELQDEIRVSVSAFDGGSGLARIGLTLQVARIDTQFTVAEDVFYDGSASFEELVFQVPIDSLYDLLGVDTARAVRDLLLPEDVDLRMHGFAADTAGNVVCAVGFEERRPCDPAGDHESDAFYEAADTAGLFMGIDVVRGRTILLDNREAVIADLVVDTLEERLYMTDITSNLVRGIPLYSDQTTLVPDSQFPVAVGSAPWGLFIGERAEDERMLIVANSGGTNLSFVDISGPTTSAAERDSVRLLTPNAVLREVRIQTDQFGALRYVEEPVIDFSDRPQFIAQDSLRRIVYSTVGTQVAPLTTLRFVITDPARSAEDDLPEVRFIITDNMINTEEDAVFAIANVDDINIRAVEGASDSIQFVGHVPGYPRQRLTTPFYAQAADAAADLNSQIQSIMEGRGDGDEAGMYYSFLSRGVWDLDELSFSDTTFIAASGDRGAIVVGEGAAQPAGRILMWFAEPHAVVSGSIPIADLVNNASEKVLGVGLNENGSMGVARGLETTFFFSPCDAIECPPDNVPEDLFLNPGWLRLFGEVANPVAGGAGADFHPDHDEVLDGGDEDPLGGGFAFTGTATHSVEITNTFHFKRVADIPIRDDVVGPLKVGPPLRSERCTEDECVVAKVYAITSAGGIVVLDVRRRDLQSNP